MLKLHFMKDSEGDDGEEKDGGTPENSHLASLSVHVTDVCCSWQTDTASLSQSKHLTLLNELVKLNFADAIQRKRPCLESYTATFLSSRCWGQNAAHPGPLPGDSTVKHTQQTWTLFT